MDKFTIDKTSLHPAGSIEKQYEEMKEDLKGYWDERGCLDIDKVESVSCSLCGSALPDFSTVLFVKYRFPYLQCPSCTLVYPSPRPRMEYVEDQYKNGRFSNSFEEIYLPSAEYRMSTIFRERVEEILMPRVPTGRLLDIGCSSGHFLKVAFDHGFDVYGIEPNPEMASFASDELNLPNIISGTLRGDEYPFEHFDVITLWDVLEHVPQPNELLLAVYRLLKPGGWIFAYTENFDSFNYLITGSDSEMFSPDVHLRHYTPKTFRKEFEKADFIVREVMTKGLDIQHIETATKLNPGKYPEKKLQFMFDNHKEWQAIINACGKGDNLRFFAQKG